MRSTFGGLETALRSLRAQQQALDTVGHNVANANTEGYSRQRVSLEPSAPYTVPAFNRTTMAGQVGTGVLAASMERLRDGFTDFQIRAQARVVGQATVTQDTLNQIEGVLNEPSDSALSGALQRFWQSWQDLGNLPSNSAARATVREAGEALASAFQRAHSQLSSVASNLDSQVGLMASQVNDMGAQIADLNKQISQVEALGDHANDLRDQRYFS